jgi:lactate dehydrogenase-like 2-hydroxyacid dehydrogenase
MSCRGVGQRRGGVDAILGTDRWTAAMLGEASRLRLIALTAVGFDMVDVAAATARGCW